LNKTHPRYLVRPPDEAVTGQLDSAVALRFVQDRVALFSKVIFLIASVYVVMAVILAVTGAEPFFAPGRGAHLLGLAITGAMWFVARRSQCLQPQALKWFDGVGTLALCVTMVVMGYRFATVNPWGVVAGMLSIFHIVLARAVIVPSTPARTAIITGLAFAAQVVALALLEPAQAAPAELSNLWIRLVGPAFTGITGTALATVASAVIYGLHREVTEARQLGQYTLEEKIGAGGMGEVYRARHAMLRRPTAIKLLRDGSERELHRFEQEVQMTARLTHPNTISIFDYGRTPEGAFYYVMELLDGVTLEDLVARNGHQPPSRVIHTLRQVCAALREAHGAGLIHRDIKPANIFLCRHGGLPDVVRVLDFGLVKELDTGKETKESSINNLVGTPLYMSPEAIASPSKVNAQSDLYALGAVGYFLLTGHPVFSGDSVVEICSHHLHTVPERPSRRVSTPIPTDLEAIVLDCLKKTPGDRPASALDLDRRLSACADANGWKEKDAEGWWQRHEGRGTGVSPVRAEPPRTLQIALDGRLSRDQAARV
jgi:serine/threonine-protein kinase